MHPWRDDYLVRSYEADVSGRLSPVYVLRYLQETAWKHARALGWAFDPREGGPIGWVLSRLRVEMDRYPAWGERVRVETWPCGIERMLALREFAIVDERGAVCGRAGSSWMVIDVAARRPIRPQQVLPDLVGVNLARPLLVPSAKLEPVEPPCDEAARRVLRSDIDVNGHVNNVRYVEWILDAVADGQRDGREIASIETTFLAEALLADEVAVRSAFDGGRSRHAIVRRQDDKEVCRMRLAWKKGPGAP
jgi:medium-chain acyl-[acyl-carrier-protein] hydrolase